MYAMVYPIHLQRSSERRWASRVAREIRKEARGTQPGVERERLIRKARQAETASHIDQWLSSPGLQTPR